MGDGSLEDEGSGLGDGLDERACSHEAMGLVEGAGSCDSKYIVSWIPGVQEVPSNLISVPTSSYQC